MFAILYRWKLKPGTEETFRDAWKAMTETIKAKYGTGGSRLHRTDDGDFVAYAVWPHREHWGATGKLPSTNPEASARMRACIAHSLPSTPLEVLEDLLGGLP